MEKEFKLDDIVVMKKSHACGTNKWIITRMGVDIKIKWQGEGVNEIGIDVDTNNVVVKINPKFYRPAEVDILLGDPSKAEKNLGWKREISFGDLVKRMVENDLKLS